MAANSKKNHRMGAVTNRTQFYNSSTGHYIKRDSETGKFLDVKSDGKPFKGVVKERSTVKSNPTVNKSIAEKAEKAVISVKNKSYITKGK